MAEVYHLVLRSSWGTNPTEDYQAASLATEGFIHCCYAAQVARSANRFHADAGDLLMLEIDPSRLTSPLRAEPAGSGERFPHVYGPINRQAVVSAQALHSDPRGQWVFPGSDNP
jgi:uncharacterized protein (DUF952 family)